MIAIRLLIEAGPKTCKPCRFLTIFRTGLVGEFHPKCEIFHKQYGEWGAEDMKRPRICINAEKMDKDRK